jgi:hypothetical protein
MTDMRALLEIEIDRLKLKQFTHGGELTRKEQELLRRLLRAKRLEIRKEKFTC